MKFLHAAAFSFAAALGLMAFGAEAATLYVSEFPNGVSTIASQEAQIYPQPAIADQTVAITGASVQSAAFNAKTRAILVECDADCSIAIGTNPTATTSNFLLANGVPYHFGVGTGEKIAVISNTTGGGGSDVNIVAVGGNAVTTSVPVNVVGGGASTFGSTFPATGTAVGFTDGTNMQPAKVDASNNQLVVGNVANGASDSGNPIKAGAVFQTTPSTLTNGQRGDLSIDTLHNLNVVLRTGGFNLNLVTGLTSADGIANTATNTVLASQSFPFAYNGSTWDRQFTCPLSAPVTVSAAATTQIIALSAGAVIRVCSFDLTNSLAGTAAFVYGTGSNCATGQTAITGAMAIATNGNLPMSSGNGSIFRTAASNALCLSAVTGNITGFVTYAQY